MQHYFRKRIKKKKIRKKKDKKLIKSIMQVTINVVGLGDTQGHGQIEWIECEVDKNKAEFTLTSKAGRNNNVPEVIRLRIKGQVYE